MIIRGPEKQFQKEQRNMSHWSMSPRQALTILMEEMLVPYATVEEWAERQLAIDNNTAYKAHRQPNY